MSLARGARLGPYEVTDAIGRGGMGEVYRATDTKLHRDVALKILPEAFAHDPDRLARFQREAHVLASLNHPNIAHVYGLEEAGGASALVMELVEGPTLEELIGTASGLPLADTIAIARQIAEALDTAHERGIIHRDLKPANVKVKPDGTVKVLDFGLAKALVADPSSASAGRDFSPAELSNSPTLTSPATAMGMILGTAAYMSPEQARGKPVDKRADIWAFGCVLFEMLTGRRAFDGEDISLILSQVLQREPDWTLLPATTPSGVRRLLERCLDKDPKRRLRDIGEARLALEGALTNDTVAPVAVRIPLRLWQRPIPAALGALTLAALAAVAAYTIAITSSSGQDVASAAPWDKFTQLTDDAGEETSPTLAPDGVSFAYASRARGTWDIYVQRVGGRNATLVAGDSGRDEAAPAFSPDGTRIAYHESDPDGGIFIVGATGESPRRLTAKGFHPAWSPDGRRIAFCDEEILTPYSRGPLSNLWIVDIDEGSPRKVFEGDGVQPVWSPSGQRLAFWSQRSGQRDILTIDVRGGEPTLVTDDVALDWIPAWSRDGRSIVFSSDRGGTMNLWRIAVDETSGKPGGAPEPVTLGVQAMIATPTFSRDGTKLLFQSTLRSVNPAALSFDPVAERVGQIRLLFRRTGVLIPNSVSQDGQWLALSNFGERQEDIFVSRTDGSGLTKLTDDAARDRSPVWSSDGNEIAFYSNRNGRYQIWLVGRDGLRARPATALQNADLMSPDYSPRGDRMVATEEQPGRPLYLFDPRRPWTEQTAQELKLRLPTGYFSRVFWSPDGKRLAVLLSEPSRKGGTLATIDLGSEEQKVVAARVPGLERLSWLPDNRRVIVNFENGDLALFDVDSGRQRALPLPPGVRLGAWRPVVSPDGRTIYVGVLDRESDIWMVERSGAVVSQP